MRGSALTKVLRSPVLGLARGFRLKPVAVVAVGVRLQGVSWRDTAPPPLNITAQVGFLIIMKMMQ